VSANTRFEVGLASDFPERTLDLVTSFDCLHDMGDPVETARHVKQTLKPDRMWMIVEPIAGDRLEQNLNPVGRLYYAGSTSICIPHPWTNRSAQRWARKQASRNYRP
jgi:hypothetical protein